MTAGDIKISAAGTIKDAMPGAVCNGNDDYIEGAGLDALGVAECANNTAKGTIAGWINVPDISGSYCLFSLGDNDAAEYLHFGVEAGKLFGACDDAATMQWDINSTNTVITPHHWHHIAITQDGVRPKMYVDGQAVAMTDTTTTDLTEWLAGLDGIDKGAIGILQMNGTTTLDFKGAIAYVRYARTCWTPDEIKAEYDYRCGFGTGSGTTGYCLWKLQADAVEYTTGAGTYDGTIVSDVQYDPQYSSLTSALRTLAPVVADATNIIPAGVDGSCAMVAVKAA